MKISFLCSSFEHGRDGVGDYVARLANALAERGHRCQVIALCDKHIAAPALTSTRAGAIDVVRIPTVDWAASRLDLAEAALRRFAPDWTSLQMVCYGYEDRGLLVRSKPRFERLRFGRHRHLMLHELWIGEAREHPAKDRAVGWLQKQLLLRTLRAWAPSAIHTSNPTYRALLQRNGVVADELPLPGNIPIAAARSATARSWLLGRVSNVQAGREPFVAGVFGSIHAGWPDAAKLRRLAQACEAGGRRLVLAQIGRAGGAGERIWNALRHELGAEIAFVALGEMAADDVSAALLGIDLGVTTTAWPLVGKSGAVAAMLEHGLPVAVTSTSYRLRRGVTPAPAPHPLLHRFGDALLERIRAGTLRRGEPQPAEAIYDRFLEALARTAAPAAAAASPSPSFAS